MSKTTIGVVAVLIVGIALAIAFGMKPAQKASESTVPAPASSSAGSLKSMLAMTGSHTCTVHYGTEAAASDGTVYVSGGMMRGDFTSKTPSGTIESHMIIKDDTSYMWSSAAPQGMKLSLSAMSAPAQPNAPKAGMDIEQNVDYSCEAWSADASKFELPSSVTFTDMSAMMQGMPTAAGAGSMPKTGTDMKALRCQACASLTGDDLAQCNAALGCK